MPAGALGIWYADQWDAATNAVPNAVLGNALKTNLFRGSRRLFSNTSVWLKSGITATDDAATAPDGSSDASTLVCTGNWWIGTKASLTLAAGTYTVVANAMRNTGSDQSFAFSKDGTVTRSPTKTATDAWQRFSYTFTAASPFNISTIYLCSIDGSTAANLQVCDLELYAGASDLGPLSPDGNLYLGAAKGSASPSVSANVIDLTGQGYGFIQLPESHSLTNVTAMAVVSKTAAGSGYDGFLSKIQSYSDFSALSGESNVARSYIGGGSIQDQAAGLWSLLNVGYHMITHRYNGTARQIWLDDILLFSANASISAYTVRDFFVGIVNAFNLYSGLKINSLALYGSALTDDQIRTAYSVLSRKATANGLTMVTNTRVLVAEGDSITEAAAGYPFLFGPNASPAVLGNNKAVATSTIADLVNRATVVDAILPPSRGSRKFILSVLIGANDLATLGAPTWLANLASYCDARRAAGWTVAVCTVLPRTSAPHNTARAIANTELRLWTTGGSTVPGIHADAICDFAADATMGPDAAASNVTYYSDGTHPTAAGQALLEPVYRAVINAL
jgi:lysophospholipase L1-like esterase